MSLEQFLRWRLILGKSAEEDLCARAQRRGWLSGGGLFSGDLVAIDEALEVVYAEEDQGIDLTRDEWERTPGEKHGAVRGRIFPRVVRWLGEIRRL